MSDSNGTRLRDPWTYIVAVMMFGAGGGGGFLARGADADMGPTVAQHAMLVEHLTEMESQKIAVEALQPYLKAIHNELVRIAAQLDRIETAERYRRQRRSDATKHPTP